MRELPSGTVTFLFSDIEGSTRLLDELGAEAYADALAEHRWKMREAFAANGGVEVDTQGDAFFAVFPRAEGALAAAAQAQEALTHGSIRVRMGIHSGQPLLTAEGYVGIDVHRGARVMAAGHGGQVLVSQATVELLDGDSRLTDLGRHRLKDLTEPQPLYQLGDSGFPPLKTLYQTNLPVQPTPLVGRESELAEVLELLSASRLLTLTGAGGSGKTRLALQAAAELVDEYRDGVWWVSLAALRDPTLVEPTIGQTVGAKDGLAEHLRGKQALLLLDNFEQLLEAAPTLADLLREAPNVRVLATSRERLGLSAEQEYPVPTLVPPEAVALFTTRARQLEPSFEPDEHVEEICRRLDGLPLALELAAARVKVLTAEQVLERLGQSLELLTAGARDAPERQRTLRATIEWSYELLDEEEKHLFARLAVFAGSFDLQAAEAVCDAKLDTLAALVDKSLLRQTDEGRFFTLETIREYAVGRLDQAAEAEKFRRRHAAFFLQLAENLSSQALGPGELLFYERIAADYMNLRGALEWSIRRDADVAMKIALSLYWYWSHRGLVAEGSLWCDRAIAAGAAGDPLVRRNLLRVAGEFALSRGDPSRGRLLVDEALELARAEGDATLISKALNIRGHVALMGGDYSRAVQFYDQALRSMNPSDFPAEGRILCLSSLGWALLLQGDIGRAHSVLERALVEAEDGASNVLQALVLNNVAWVRLARGDYDAAAEIACISIEKTRKVRDLKLLLEAIYILGRVAGARGEPLRAARLAGAADVLLDELGVSQWDAATPFTEHVEAAQAALGDLLWERERTRGAEMTVDEALEYALANLD
jgi:predicted ATPase